MSMVSPSWAAAAAWLGNANISPGPTVRIAGVRRSSKRSSRSVTERTLHVRRLFCLGAQLRKKRREKGHFMDISTGFGREQTETGAPERPTASGSEAQTESDGQA